MQRLRQRDNRGGKRVSWVNEKVVRENEEASVGLQGGSDKAASERGSE